MPGERRCHSARRSGENGHGNQGSGFSRYQSQAFHRDPGDVGTGRRRSPGQADRDGRLPHGPEDGRHRGPFAPAGGSGPRGRRRGRGGGIGRHRPGAGRSRRDDLHLVHPLPELSQRPSRILLQHRPLRVHPSRRIPLSARRRWPGAWRLLQSILLRHPCPGAPARRGQDSQGCAPEHPGPARLRDSDRRGRGAQRVRDEARADACRLRRRFPRPFRGHGGEDRRRGDR